jgi:signal transduction histidine kinase
MPRSTKRRGSKRRVQSSRAQPEQRVADRSTQLAAANRRLQKATAQCDKLARQLLEICEREKRRLGEDLHDTVCQELIATAFLLKSTAEKVEAKSSVAAENLREAAQIVNQNVDLTREFARGLQPVEMTAVGLNAALQGLAARVTDRGTLRCDFRVSGGARVRSNTTAMHLYRIAQEALTNAVKHSDAKNVVISLERNAKTVSITIGDDGHGISARRSRKGLGLDLMKYRAETLGGTLRIETGQQTGTIITACIPRPR